jgi:hypothetical protein
VLNVVRQTLKRGAVPAYEEVEALIARRLRHARIPMYWVCLQAPSAPTAILYLNVYNQAEDADRAAATYTNMVERRHPELVRLQRRLTTYGAGSPVSMLTRGATSSSTAAATSTFATMGALRVTVFHVRAGRRANSWTPPKPGVRCRGSCTRTHDLDVLPGDAAANSLGTRPRLPRGLRQLKGVYTIEKPVVYAVRPAMSHAPPEYVTASPRFRQVRRTKSEVRTVVLQT